MSRERWSWLVLAALLLAGGLIAGRPFAGRQAGLEGIPSEADLPLEENFRSAFWERREPDLLVQVGLILSGALGIAALLPREGEE
jgi:hypothetical protein